MGTDIVFKISQELNRTFKFADTFLSDIYHFYSSANNQAHKKIFSGNKADFFLLINISIKCKLTSR